MFGGNTGKNSLTRPSALPMPRFNRPWRRAAIMGDLWPPFPYAMEADEQGATNPGLAEYRIEGRRIRRPFDQLIAGLSRNGLPASLSQKVTVTPDGGERSLRELMVIDEVFRQRKPLLAICCGHQLVNVALGGTLVADIPSQCPGAINHRRMDRRNQVVHEVRLTEPSILAKITGRRMLG